MMIAYCVFENHSGALDVETMFQEGGSSHNWGEYLGDDARRILIEGFYLEEDFQGGAGIKGFLESMVMLLNGTEQKHEVTIFLESMIRRPLRELVGRLALQKHVEEVGILRDATDGRR